MSEDDQNYFRMRAEQESRAVKQASSPAAAGVHQALAARYSALAGNVVAAQASEPGDASTPE